MAAGIAQNNITRPANMQEKIPANRIHPQACGIWYATFWNPARDRAVNPIQIAAFSAASLDGLEASQSLILVYGSIATTWLLTSVAMARMATAARFSPAVGRIKAIAKTKIDTKEIANEMMFFIVF